MEKVMMVPVKVEDVTGLMLELKRNGFSVRNVGSDPNCTHVYLELEEEKDPTPFVESWVGKKAPQATDRAAFEARLADYQAMMNPSAAVALLETKPAAPPKKLSFIRRIFGMGPPT